MKLKDLLKGNRENIQSITITNGLITYFKNDVEVLDIIDIQDGYKIIVGDITLKLDEFQANTESYYSTDKIFYFDLIDFKVDLKLK
ncbi:hypothetical protein [Fusobacterium gonidiaformans]|jgi:hypothetical protein|uniref:hypothetical protein n=1 Tax=Fusobacterium gonidiaformans TaxID=849 RepID=UPI00307F3C26